MARKVTAKKSPAAKAVASTPVRNTAIPKAVAVAAPVAKAVSHETIAFRAFEISRSGNGGSELDNWFRAERELRGV